ncbi:fibronectin type III domain-containing protein [Natrinema zhouii]|nr:fibronectin type III domain-containing protein [Natrinema zhouii]
MDYVGYSEITLSWDESPDEEINQYRVERSESGGSWVDLGTTTNTSFTDGSIAQNTDYQYRVRGEADGGLSTDWETTVTRTSGDRVRSFITGDTTNDTIDLSWTNPSGDWTNIEIYRDTASHSSLSGYQQIDTVTGGSYTDSGLTDGRTYHYRAVVVYPDADSSPTPDETGTTDLPAPTFDSLVGGSQQVDLTFGMNDNNSEGEFTLHRDGSQIATLDFSETQYTDTGTTADGEKYDYTLERDTGDATASSGVSSAMTELPAPTSLSADAVSTTEVDLSWTATHNNGDTRVEYRESDAGSWTTFSTISRNTEAETVTGLLNGEQYDARVVAQTDHTETEDQ